MLVRAGVYYFDSCSVILGSRKKPLCPPKWTKLVALRYESRCVCVYIHIHTHGIRSWLSWIYLLCLLLTKPNFGKMLYYFAVALTERRQVGLAPSALLLHEVGGVFVPLKVNESSEGWSPTSHHTLFFLRIYFPRHYIKSLKNFATSFYYSLDHWLPVFKSCKALLGFFEKHRYGDLLTGSEFCTRLRRAVRLVAVLAPFPPFSNGAPLCFWSYLGFMDVRFFLCLFLSFVIW